MEPPAKHSHNAALKRLLEEGTRSYLEATAALVAYQQEVQKKCRAVVERSLAEYASALKVRLRGRLETGLFSGRAWSVPLRHERTEAVPQ